MTQDSDDRKVFDLAEARKRQKTVRVDAGGRRVGEKGKRPASKAGGSRIWQYVQLVAFLAVMAYLMQLCSGGF